MTRELAATCLYVGYVPGAPGTFGSVLALALGLAAHALVGGAVAGLIIFAAAIAITAPGARLGTWAEHFYNRKDPPPFVLDELAGCLLSIAPAFIFFPNVVLFLSGGLPFGFFRVFDIAKPFPANRLERIRGGWGIMLDDLAAAVYAAIASLLTLAILAWANLI